MNNKKLAILELLHVYISFIFYSRIIIANYTFDVNFQSYSSLHSFKKVLAIKYLNKSNSTSKNRLMK